MANLKKMFPFKKSKITTILGDFEQKVNNAQTQTKCQIDQDTKPIKDIHWNSQKVTYKMVKTVLKISVGHYAPITQGG